MPKKPRSEEYYFEDPPQDATSGFVQPASNESNLATLLLDLIGETARLATLLKEADTVAFKDNEKRLNAFLDLVKQLPKNTPPPKVLGFQPPLTKKRKKA
jgi:hypothetical protein